METKTEKKYTIEGVEYTESEVRELALKHDQHLKEMKKKHTLGGVKFTRKEVEDLPYGFHTKNGVEFYKGNIFDTPCDYNDEFHPYLEFGMARLFLWKE